MALNLSKGIQKATLMPCSLLVEVIFRRMPQFPPLRVSLEARSAERLAFDPPRGRTCPLSHRSRGISRHASSSSSDSLASSSSDSSQAGGLEN